MENYVLGVDLGGTKIAVLGSDKIEKLDGVMRIPSNYQDTSIKIEDSLIGAVKTYINEVAGGKKPDMIGFGLKDFCDNKSGIWHAHPTPNGRVPIPFADMVEEAVGVPAVIDNDVHVGTLAEMAYGAGRKYDDFLFINVGTGLSMGAVIDGRLLRGSVNYAGELGHVMVESDGEPCDFCGGRGCLEEIAAGQGIIRQAMHAIEHHPETSLKGIYEANGRVTSRDVFAQADAGDEQASRIAQRVFKCIATATCCCINVFNPAAVIFGGGVMTDGWLISRLQEYIPNHVIGTDRDALQEVSLSELGSDYVGVLGAIALANGALKDRK